MYFSALIASSFGDFLKNNLAWIIVVAVVIGVAIIVAVTIRLKKKPSKYVADEIDKSVDDAAKKKSERAETLPPANSSVDKTDVSEFEPVEVPANNSQPEEDEFEREARIREEKLIGPTHSEEPSDKKSDDKKSRSEEKRQTAEKKTVKEEKKPMKKGDDKEIDKPEVDDKEEDAHKRPQSYRILYDKETEMWEVRKDNAKRVIRRVKTKKEALEIAKELSQNQDLNLVVHKKDGKFQKKR